MRILLALGLLLLVPQATPQKARAYYDEIYKAGGLDRMADGQVCFDEDPENENFFIVAESKDIRNFLKLDGSFSKMPKAVQEQLNKDFLIVRGYAKGICF